MAKERYPMEKPPVDPHFTINVVPGQNGAEFDLTELHIPVGGVTVWINQTDSTQVILPLTPGVRRVMTLAPKDQEGRVWMMGSPQPFTAGWQLQSNPAAQITVTTTM
jgi:hypothetical protein